MISNRARRVSGSLGFTLLETLVGVAILAAFAGVIPRTLVAARANINASQAWIEARLVAESVLSDRLGGSDLRAGTLRGTINGRRWTAVLKRDRAFPDAAEGITRAPLRVELEVEVMPRQTLKLETMRIGVAS